ANAPGALDLHEEQVDRVLGPGELEPFAGERPVLDFGARKIKDAGAGLIDPPAAGGAVRLGAADEVGRHPVDRYITRLRRTRALDLRLVIAGREGAAVAHFHPVETVIEEARRKARVEA